MTDKESSHCDFCRHLENRKFFVKYYNKTLKENGEPVIRCEMSVALVRRTWHKGVNKKCAGIDTDYRYRGIGYKLNYCPECGKYLRKGKKQT